MKAHIIRELPDQAVLLVAGDCDEGWVQVVSSSGATRGYVGGWALQEIRHDPATANISPSFAPVGISSSELSVDEALSGPGHMKSASWIFNSEQGVWAYSAMQEGWGISNEQLAVQITENRLKVLALERRIELVERALTRMQGRLTFSGRNKR